MSSDIDLLAITDDDQLQFSPYVYSIYSYKKIKTLWIDGNPFAWHLHCEARLVFSSDTTDYLKELGEPGSYQRCAEDCSKFYLLFSNAMKAVNRENMSLVFELSNVFLAMRNFATCFALGKMDKRIFSRDAALRLGDRSVPISLQTHQMLQRARILSTRGVGEPFSNNELRLYWDEIERIGDWMKRLLQQVNNG